MTQFLQQHGNREFLTVENSPSADNVIAAMEDYSKAKKIEEEISEKKINKLNQELHQAKQNAKTGDEPSTSKRQHQQSPSSTKKGPKDSKQPLNPPKKIKLDQMTIIGAANHSAYDLFLLYKVKIVKNDGTVVIRRRFLDLHVIENCVIIKMSDDRDGPSKLLSTVVLFYESGAEVPLIAFDQRN